MADPVLLIRAEGPVLHAVMNRPDRLNALSADLVTALRDFFAGLYWRHEVRVVTLAGAGRAFSAGLDLKARPEAGHEASVADALVAQRRISEIVIAMRRCPQPIVALVDGPAAGGGFALALASDIRIITPRTRMNAAFIRIGLSACDIGVSYFLPRMVGQSVAADYMLTGRFMGPEEAVRHGLARAMVAPEQIEAAGDEVVGELLRATPLGLRLTKEALNHAVDMSSLEAVVAMEDRNQILASRGPDFEEGIRAFLEKRPPRYGEGKRPAN